MTRCLPSFPSPLTPSLSQSPTPPPPPPSPPLDDQLEMRHCDARRIAAISAGVDGAQCKELGDEEADAEDAVVLESRGGR